MTSSKSIVASNPSRVERRRARNREALVGAARRLFARDGFDKTTIAQIAEHADLGFGTFYSYFADKDAVLYAVVNEGRREIEAVLYTGDNDSGPAPAALARFTERFLQVMERNWDLVALMAQMWWRDTQAQRGSAAFRDRLASEVARIISRGVAVGEFSPGDAGLRARLIAGMHVALLTPERSEGAASEIIETLCELELRALGAQPATASVR